MSHSETSTAHSRANSLKENGKDTELATAAPATAAPTFAESPEKQQDVEKTADGEKTGEPELDDGVRYLDAKELTVVMIGLLLAVLLIALDNTIIATAIPIITNQFDSLADVGWYASAYLLTACALQLVYGKLYKMFSVKWVFLIAIALFEIGSAICGAAPNSVALIVGRAIAGIGSAGIFSGALTILGYTTPMEKRPIYFGIISSMFGVASIVGPLMGGGLTDNVSWRWCFYINLPIGAITILDIFFFLRLPKRTKQKSTFREKAAELDLIGTALFMPAIICLLLALQWGGTKYAFDSARIIALFVVFGVLIIGFGAVQVWKKEAATIPPRIFAMRNIAFACWYVVTVAGAFFALIYYVPIWFQAIKGASATKSGIMLLPMILGVVIASISSGGIVAKIGYPNPLMYLCSVIAPIGLGLMTTWKTNTGHAEWIGYQFLYGFGTGLGLQQGIIIAQASLKTEDIPVGSAVVVLAQMLGGALFVSVTQNIFTNHLATGIANLGIDGVTSQLVLATGATNLKTVFNEEQLPLVLKAYSDALTTSFQVPLALVCLSIVGTLGVKWTSVKQGGGAPAAAA